MPLDGNGNYTRARDWTDDEGSALNIEASLFDEHDDDLATALNTAFYRDGQAAATGTFDMNGNKIDLDADQDTSIHASSDDQIDFEVGANDAFRILTETTPVNGLSVRGSDTGNAVQVATIGGDANRSIDLSPAGTGTVQVGAVPITALMQIHGLVPSNDADGDHDINFTAGVAADSDGEHFIQLASEITKQIDATWVVGDDLGGHFSGATALGNNLTFHLFVIRRSDTGVVDAGFDSSVTCANIPTNYDSYRRVGSVLTDGSANILAFTAAERSGGGLIVTRASADTSLDISTTNPGTSEVVDSLGIPTGVRYLAHCQVLLTESDKKVVLNNNAVRVYDVDATDVSVAFGNPTVGDWTTVGADQTTAWQSRSTGFVQVMTDTSAQVAYRLNASAATTSVGIHAPVYEDLRAS